MPVTIVLVVVLGSLAVLVAWLIQRRSTPDEPTPTSWPVPAQLDRHDFPRPEADWLVVLFSSATCLSCRGTWQKVEAMATDAVAVADVEAVAQRDLHQRYGIEAVPCVVVADAEGVVRASFLGEPSTADLWAAVAQVRGPEG